MQSVNYCYLFLMLDQDSGRCRCDINYNHCYELFTHAYFVRLQNFLKKYL